MRALHALAFAVLLSACRSGPPPAPARAFIGRAQALDGSQLSFSSLRGKPVIASVITTWTNLALAQVPQTQRVHARFGDRVRYLWIVLEPTPGAAAAFASTFSPPGQVVQPEELRRVAGPGGPFGEVKMIPTTALVDAEGTVRAVHPGLWRAAELSEALAPLLSDQP